MASIPSHDPVLVYHAGFVHNAARVVVNHLGIPDTLWISTSRLAGEQASPSRGPVPTAQLGPFGETPASDPAMQYLALRITKPLDTSPTVVVICGLPVANVPHVLGDGDGSVVLGNPPQVLLNPRSWFRLRATFALPTPLPAASGDQWAATLIVRDNTDNEDDNTATVRVGATHQVRDGGKIALGAGQVPPNSDGTPAIVPPPVAELIPFETAYPFLSARTFELETDINNKTREGISRLRTPGHEWQERRWTTPFDASNPAAPKVRSVGVGLAMALGAGSPIVRVHEFQMFAFPQPV